MYNMEISKEVKYVGVNDHEIDLFEGQYRVPNGMAYNSYVILDDKIAVMDSVDGNFGDEWLTNIEELLGDRKPDFIVVHHMEPDHSASLNIFMEKYPDAKVVSSKQAFAMMKNYFGTDYLDRQVVVGEGSTLELGKHVLKFIGAPLVHWPEVVMSYDLTDKILFSADAFGKFGALDVEEDWVKEARRYYIGIVGKFGPQVQAVLKKAAALDIKTICSLHGPVLSGDLTEYLSLYNVWSSYQAEEDGVVICYTSVYGHTKGAVDELKNKLLKEGKKVELYDLARDDMSAALAACYQYSKVVLATTTYQNDIYPYMKDFINHLLDHTFQNRVVGLIENGSWAPSANKVMKNLLATCKDLTILEQEVHIKGALNPDSEQELEALKCALCA